MSNKKLRVVDLFSGLGGYSQGAILAGAAVVEVYDNDPLPLKLLGANIPGVKVNRVTLGPGGDAFELPPAAPDLHVHASTPCTELSAAKYNKTQQDVDSGVKMLRWALDLFMEREEYSFSLENVSTPTSVLQWPVRRAFTVDSTHLRKVQSLLSSLFA
jgi:site-specific DNA-cytosine methylase